MSIFPAQIQQFLTFVKSIYKELPNHLNKVFERPASVPVPDVTELNLGGLLCESYTITSLHTERRNAEGNAVTVSRPPTGPISPPPRLRHTHIQHCPSTATATADWECCSLVGPVTAI